jgi:cell division septation protein DedD
MPLVWIPATLCVGLLIAAIYLGGRILTASHAPAPVQPIQIPAPVHTPVVVQTPAPVAATPAAALAVPSAPPAKVEPSVEQVPTIAPKEGERYIQVGALDLERTRHYIAHLRETKLEPHVAPGPTPELLRVLIGPFADEASLASIKTQLDGAGIPNFIRKY